VQHAKSIARGQCDVREITLAAVVACASELEAGAPISCAGRVAADALPRNVTSFQLFLELNYDTELFHPYVPLFIPFENIMVANAGRNAWKKFQNGGGAKLGDFEYILESHPEIRDLPLNLLQQFSQLLDGSLRRDVQYITVCQRPAGPGLAITGPFFTILARTLVLSAGGWGHVPIPLLARVLPRLRDADATVNASKLYNALSPKDAALVLAAPVPAYGKAAFPLAFFGSAREGVRATALEILERVFPRFVTRSLPNDPLQWLPVFVNVTLALAPRGTGITSFRLYEALQAGVPPVYIFDDRPWLPYLHISERAGIGAGATPATTSSLLRFLPPRGTNVTRLDWDLLAHIVEVDSLEAWARTQLSSLVDGDAGRWHAMRDAAEHVRDSHFSYDGVMRQVWRFLADPWDAELFCAAATPSSAMLKLRRRMEPL
jgi:hypothetical protein